MKTGKWPGMDDIPSELISSGVDRGRNSKTLTYLYQKIWEQKSGQRFKEEKPQTMQGLQDLKLDQPPKQGAASFGAGRSRVELIFNGRVIIAKHLEHQHNLYDNLIYFKKAFDRVFHHGLWKVLIGGTIYGGFVQAIRACSLRPSQQRVILNNQLEEFFRASRRRQIRVLTRSCSVQIFLKIIHETLNEQLP